MAAQDEDQPDSLESHRRFIAERHVREYLLREFGDLDKRLLMEHETVSVRKLLEQDARTQWLWSTARTWLLFIAAAVTGVTLGINALRDVLKRLVS
jgi:hypothetical protein